MNNKKIGSEWELITKQLKLKGALSLFNLLDAQVLLLRGRCEDIIL
jgi:hypothetical protein